MAEEDIIWAKKRHLFGGFEPSNMIKFTASRSGTKVTLTATLPNDTMIENQTLCAVAGCVIRKSTSGYPKNEFEGTLVADITESKTITDTSSGTTYYSAFPYSDQEVYNRNTANRVQC